MLCAYRLILKFVKVIGKKKVSLYTKDSCWSYWRNKEKNVVGFKVVKPFLAEPKEVLNKNMRLIPDKKLKNHKPKTTHFEDAATNYSRSRGRHGGLWFSKGNERRTRVLIHVHQEAVGQFAVSNWAKWKGSEVIGKQSSKESTFLKTRCRSSNRLYTCKKVLKKR